MKAISIYQPWASLILAGLKRYETRGWQTRHRGPLGIHASRVWTHQQKQFCQAFGIPDLLGLDPDDLPRGALLGCVNLEGCRYTGFKDPSPLVRCLSMRERQFGDFSSDRYGWELSNPRPFPRPLPMPGRQGLFQIKDPHLGMLLPLLKEIGIDGD